MSAASFDAGELLGGGVEGALLKSSFDMFSPQSSLSERALYHSISRGIGNAGKDFNGGLMWWGCGQSCAAAPIPSHALDCLIQRY